MSRFVNKEQDRGERERENMWGLNSRTNFWV